MEDKLTLGQTLNHEFTFTAQSRLTDEQFFSQPADRIGHIVLGLIKEVADQKRQLVETNKILALQNGRIVLLTDQISRLEDRIIALEEETFPL